MDTEGKRKNKSIRKRENVGTLGERKKSDVIQARERHSRKIKRDNYNGKRRC